MNAGRTLRARKRKGPKPRLYSKDGVHLATGLDQCDCLVADCPGCFLDCPKCSSPKCGPVCRSNRTFCYTQVLREQDKHEEQDA